MLGESALAEEDWIRTSLSEDRPDTINRAVARALHCCAAASTIHIIVIRLFIISKDCVGLFLVGVFDTRDHEGYHDAKVGLDGCVDVLIYVSGIS